MSRLLAALISMNLMLAGPAFAESTCSAASDQAAFDVAALKSELSILAIACGNQDDYNHFVERYRPELVSQDHVVNAWFAKQYGRSAQSHYDAFITLLANEQSSAGQHQGSDFCPRLKILFSEAMAVPEVKLLPQYAAAKDLVPPAIGSCESESAPVKASATRRPARHR